MQAHLGSTAYNIVASFRTPSDTLPATSWVSHIPFFDSLDLIAVKHRHRPPQAPDDTLARKIGLPKLIANAKHLPTILFHNSTFTEYAATSVGHLADPKYLNNHSSLSQQILTDVLTALIYLHENNIIHRDLRWDNIIEYEGHGYLIDLGSADPALPRIEQKYFGGYICCPARVAGSINTLYKPEKADDYDAYVLLFNTLLFPAWTRGYNSVRLEDSTSDESKRFGSFWRWLKRSVVWGGYMTAAETGDVQLLGQMPEMVVMMESCEEPGDLTIQPEWEEIHQEQFLPT
ncbi:hypothetical protein BDD12DRAFT_923920 [Trichophaea hybrida]|nr:hypothetical protein BDD12DRAFT_923920 [Trichophaea hybrida]